MAKISNPNNMKQQKPLPKLPRGMGNYDYYRGKIRYRKAVQYKTYSTRLSVVGETVPEVNRLMQEKEVEWRKSCEYHVQMDSSVLFQTQLLRWMELYKQNDMKDRSYDRLESTYNNYIKNTKFGRLSEDMVTSDAIQHHLTSLKSSRTGKALSYSTIKKIYDLLNQYFRYKYAREPHANPMLTVPRPNKEKIQKKLNSSLTQKEEMTILTDEEMEALTKVAYLPYKVGLSGYKNGLAVVFMMWTFLRSGEARGLQWKDIDLENDMITIEKQVTYIKDRDENATKKYNRSIDSTKYNSERSFKMIKIASDIAKEYKKRCKPSSEDDYFLSNSSGTPLTDTAIRYSLQAMLKAAGITKHIRIHDLRHSGISYLLRHEVPVEVVSRMAGHKEIETTYRVYYQILEKQKTDAIDLLNEKTYQAFTEKLGDIT